MYCSKCGFELPDDANFCLKCGLSLQNNISEHKKRICITVINSPNLYSFSLNTTEPDLLSFCKHQFQSLRINQKYYEFPRNGAGIPGRYYFIIEDGFFKKYNNNILTLHNLIRDKLLTEGWVETAGIGTFTKDM